MVDYARALPQGSLAAKPVVTYDIDGAKEGVLDGQTGYVLPPFDKQQLGAAVEFGGSEKQGTAGGGQIERRLHLMPSWPIAQAGGKGVERLATSQACSRGL